MKKVLFILLTVCLMVSCSDPNERYVKKAVRIMDKRGIFAQGSEWKKAKEEALSAQPSSFEEAQEIVLKAGKVAGGKHTYLMTADEVNDNDTSSWEMPTVKLLENGIAYVKLPAFSGNAEEGVKYANTVLNAIPDALQGVIIDLRGNRGGNMYPMIAAVHRFLPNDNILQFKTRHNTMKIKVEYVLKVAGVAQQAPINCPVALLTDELTASSGEAVLLCFRGLSYARTFGLPTAGYCSGNQIYALPGGSQLVLTVGEDIARTGEAFCDDPIKPDVTTETPFEDALEWINNCKP
jgi:C-terminal processing protease CtpA/Prc